LTADRQRVDKWLWHARLVRTRSAAAGLATSGRVRINGRRIDAAGRLVRPGDVVTVALDGSVRILRVAGFAERRGSAEMARGLYEDVNVEAPGAVLPSEQGERAAKTPMGAASLAPTRPMR
jgi:ribosome-associated heat shock protein Hsp15